MLRYNVFRTPYMYLTQNFCSNGTYTPLSVFVLQLYKCVFRRCRCLYTSTQSTVYAKNATVEMCVVFTWRHFFGEIGYSIEFNVNTECVIRAYRLPTFRFLANRREGTVFHFDTWFTNSRFKAKLECEGLAYQ